MLNEERTNRESQEESQVTQSGETAREEAEKKLPAATDDKEASATVTDGAATSGTVTDDTLTSTAVTDDKESSSMVTDGAATSAAVTDDKKAPAPDDKRGRGFVIRKKSPAVNVVRAVAVSELLSRYPALKEIKNFDADAEPLLYISEGAERTIKEHIAWGKKTRQNVREQGGILVGRPVLAGERLVGIAEYAIPANLSHASAAYLQMGTETWREMLDIFDAQYKEAGLYVIGWFHTHPNSLPVFMSGTDMGTQRAFFNQEWHFSIVMNPHRKLIACFHSAEAVSCEYCPKDFAGKR